MLLSYVTLAVALSLSVIAAYYSIAGLAAIFAAAVVPIIVMGSILELGKVVATLWLHEYWRRCRLIMKLYLVPAVVILMIITSMGIFGFLSKAHSDQGLVSGDSQAKVAIYDEKIRTAKDNIEANRKALRQLDEAVDQVMARSADEKGADKAVAVRRSQQKERAKLLGEIEAEQKKIADLNQEAAPLRAEFRKIESEVGPIKYIAALIYGDNPEVNVLERAVRWVIIVLVIVFDPLAIVLLLAATESMKWERESAQAPPDPKYEPDNGPLSTAQIDQIVQSAEPPRRNFWPPSTDLWPFSRPQKPVEPVLPVENTSVPPAQEPAEPDDEDTIEENKKAAVKAWKNANPGETIKRQRQLLSSGAIDRLPWEDMAIQADNEPPAGSMRGFGIAWPTAPVKGDTFLRVDRLPSALYKFNGKNWIEIDKTISDQYSYDAAYIDHLIGKINSGEYDPELLTEAEMEQIQQRLKNAGANK